MTINNVGATPPPWGYDSGISKDEASFQTAMNLGAIQAEIDHYLKSVKEGNPDQKALDEIQRLVAIINSYQNEGKVNVPVNINALLQGPPALINTEGKVNLDALTHYTNAFRTESGGDIAAKILAWAFPTDGNATYNITATTNSDTKLAALRFMISAGSDSNIEKFFSQGGVFGSFAKEAASFIKLYLEDNKDKVGEGYEDELLQTFEDKDPDHKLANFQNFLKYVYGDVEDLGGVPSSEALTNMLNHLTAGRLQGVEPDDLDIEALSGGQGYGASAPSAPGAGAPPPSLPWPTPPMPPSGCPDGLVPTKPWSWGDGDPCYDKLMQFMEYFGYVKTNDPTAMMRFAQYVANLSEAGKLKDPKISQLLDSMGGWAIFKKGAELAGQYAFFTADPPDQAVATMRKTLNAMAAAISGQTDPRMKEIFFYLNHMANEVDPDGKNYCDKFKTAHTATAADEAKYPGVTEGDFIWKTNEGQPNEHLYDWTHPITTGAFGDRFMVGLCVGAQGIPSMEKIVSGLNDLLKLYKVNTLQDLLLKFKKDPMFAILLWIMTYHDQNAQANMSGANNQSQVVSKILTDKYANGLQRLASSAGKWSDKDVEDLRKLMASGEDFMKLAPEMKGIADNWAENVTGPIGNIKVTYTDRDGNKAEASLKDYLNMPDPGPDSKKDILNRALSPNPSGEQPNPNYQVLTQATTTGAQLANGQSKNITTQLSTLATLESAIDKTLDQIVNPTNGLMSMMKYFVNQQRAT